MDASIHHNMLGLNVIKDHFGHFVWLVSDVLLTEGKQTLGEVVKNVKSRKKSNGGMVNPELSALGEDIDSGSQVCPVPLILYDSALVCGNPTVLSGPKCTHSTSPARLSWHGIFSK
jgi:hypothetical protein